MRVTTFVLPLAAQALVAPRPHMKRLSSQRQAAVRRPRRNPSRCLLALLMTPSTRSCSGARSTPKPAARAQALEDYCPPLPEAFEAQAALTADGAAEAYKASLDDPSGFWASEADRYHWQTPFDRSNVYSANFKRSAGPIAARWFEDGSTNIAYNCLDRQVEAGLGDKLCFIAERNDEGETSPLQPETYTYAEALEETKKLAAALRAKGVKKGDRVALFMPMVPELAIAMLACARIGAVHTVVFGGFSRDSLASRIASAGATCVIAADGVRRGGKVIDLWGIAKDALASVFLRRPCLSFTPSPRHDRRVSFALVLATRDAPWGSRSRGTRPSCVARGPRRTPSTADARDRRRGTRARRSRAAR